MPTRAPTCAPRAATATRRSARGCSTPGPSTRPAFGCAPGSTGELVQDDTTDTLLFGFGHLVADLSRFMTLEVGDVILTGTPAGASVALPGQRLEVEVNAVADDTVTTGRLVTDVVDAPALGPWGSPPVADEAAKADAYAQHARARRSP